MTFGKCQWKGSPKSGWSASWKFRHNPLWSCWAAPGAAPVLGWYSHSACSQNGKGIDLGGVWVSSYSLDVQWMCYLHEVWKMGSSLVLHYIRVLFLGQDTCGIIVSRQCTVLCSGFESLFYHRITALSSLQSATCCVIPLLPCKRGNTKRGVLEVFERGDCAVRSERWPWWQEAFGWSQLLMEQQSVIWVCWWLSQFHFWLIFYLVPGCDSTCEKLPKAHDFINAADPAHRLEHPYRKCCFISLVVNVFNWNWTWLTRSRTQ